MKIRYLKVEMQTYISQYDMKKQIHKALAYPTPLKAKKY